MQFILPGDLAEKFASLADIARAAAPSERLGAFGMFARHVAGFVGARCPQAEAVDRLQAFAETSGIGGEL